MLTPGQAFVLPQAAVQGTFPHPGRVTPHPSCHVLYNFLATCLATAQDVPYLQTSLNKPVNCQTRVVSHFLWSFPALRFQREIFSRQAFPWVCVSSRLCPLHVHLHGAVCQLHLNESGKNINLALRFPSYIKYNLKWIIDLNIKSQKHKTCRKKIKEKLFATME